MLTQSTIDALQAEHDRAVKKHIMAWPSDMNRHAQQVMKCGSAPTLARHALHVAVIALRIYEAHREEKP